MKMRQSLADIEAQFVEEIESDRERRERLHLVVVDRELGRRAEQDGHHAVVAVQPTHQAGVAINPCRHGTHHAKRH